MLPRMLPRARVSKSSIRRFCFRAKGHSQARPVRLLVPRRSTRRGAAQRLSLLVRFEPVPSLDPDACLHGEASGSLSAFDPAPTLDQGEGRAPAAWLGQLGLRVSAERGKLVLAQRPQQAGLERDTELKRQTQVRVAGLECDHVCVELWLFDTDIA